MKNLITKTKQVLRQEMEAKLQAVPCKRQDEMSRDVCARIAVLPLYKQARRVMAFLHMPGEIDLDPLIEQALKEQKEVYVPLCLSGRRMEAQQLSSMSAALVGAYGIRTAPAGSAIIDPADLDLILVPGLAFDGQGNRLGRGAGFYDRFLLRARGETLVAVGWDMQVVPAVPVEAHDMTIPAILTEQRFIFQHT